MTLSPLPTLTLQDFLKLPQVDESPAWEFIDGKITQKPMPKTRHSLLQKQLLKAIDRASDVYTALPEFRCNFGGQSIVPDVAVVAWERIPVKESGEPEDDFMAAPDWTIEILSPDQPATRVIENILYCLAHDCQLGWLIDPDDYSVLVFRSNQQPQVFRGNQTLIVLPEVDLDLTAAQVFEWLQIKKKMD